jgi:hypothetical protein
MSTERDHIIEEQRRLKAEYGKLFDELLAILFRHDPMGINFEDNTDEYSPEVRTILPRLRECKSVEDTCRVIHEEFARWFSGDAGPAERYAPIAADVWALWQQSRIA